MAQPEDRLPRLDSWKVIAAYLDRDVRTVRRWERELGLPIRRVRGARGRSVFAYVAEIDEWLHKAPVEERKVDAVAGADDAPAESAAPLSSRSRPRRVMALIGLAAAATLMAVMAWRARERVADVDALHLHATPDGLAATLADGGLRWRYQFAPEYTWALPDLRTAPPVTARDPAGVYVATEVGQRRSDGHMVSGALTWLNADGTLQRSFSFDDTVVFHMGTYGPPWAITSYGVIQLPDGTRRIAIAAHHWVWGASLVTVLDEHWQRHGTFVHFGWIQSVQWLSPARLIVSGFSNARDGALIALLDPTLPTGVNGQGPEPPGSAGYCETCAAGAPVRVVIMPRSPLNRATGSPFNRAEFEITDGRVYARTLEVPDGGPRVVDAIYEFSPSLDLLRASYSDSYREMRRALEARGALRPTPDSGDDERPRAVHVWDASNGWRSIEVGKR